MRKILIIGATSAIAQMTARLFAHDGDALFLAARNHDKLKVVADDLLVRGASRADFMSFDADDFSHHGSLIEKANESLSGLDTVLIAHGTLADQKACEKSYESTERELKTNFLSVVSLLTILANRFEAEKGGCIAVISSVAGDRGRGSNYVYGTAKAAVSTFLQGLRNRLHKFGVSVITIKPGLVDTPMTAHLKKNLLFASPESVAKGIYRAIQKKREVVYLPFFWRWVMCGVRNIPEWLFKKWSL